MSVRAHISLTKDVPDLDKARDWYHVIYELLNGNTSCTIGCSSTNCEPQQDIIEEPDNG